MTHFVLGFQYARFHKISNTALPYCFLDLTNLGGWYFVKTKMDNRSITSF